jgi:sigma-B regulation protein RsbU (phosphoserine phosphatase)
MHTAEDGTFLWVNRRFCDWVERSPTELVERMRFQDLLSMGGRIFHQTHWAPLLRMQGSISEVKLELNGREGQPIPMVLNALRHEGRGVVTHHLAAFIARDRDKYERELVRSRASLEVAVAESTRLQAESKVRAIFAEQMIGIVSHDLRNPLSAIRMGVQLLAADALSDAQQKVTLRMSRSVDRAVRLIQDLLDFAQARVGGGFVVNPEPIPNLHELVAQTVDELALVYPGRSLEHRRIGSGPCVADGDRLAQAVGNLVSNAMTYGAPNEPVSVVSTLEERSISLSVHNQGEPIAQELQARLFEPMARGTKVPSATRSVGLGLFIVAQIANAHGGRAAVRSTAAEGTTFWIELPRAPSS